jgi:hypothetical protein
MRFRTTYRLWHDPRDYRDGEPEIDQVKWREFFALLAGAALAYIGVGRML